MNLSNYYWYFKSALPPKLCDEIIKYALSKKEVMARTGGFGNKLSKEDKAKYNSNVYYPYNPKIDNLVENENIDYVNYISICFDTYTGKGDKKEKDGVWK